MQKIVPDDAILIPNSAKRVFQGVIFDVYQWEQELYDGTTRTFEMLKRPDTVEVLVVREDKILVVHDEQPNRGVRVKLPMGRVDEKESWEDAARRELREETGLECAEWKLIMVRQPIPKIEWFVVTFLAHDISGQAEQVLDPGEKISPEWRDYGEVRRAVLEDKEPNLSYNARNFRPAKTIKELLMLPEFSGKQI